MSKRLLESSVLEVVLLLFALYYVFNPIMLWAIYFLPVENSDHFLFDQFYWIGQLLLGFIMFKRIEKKSLAVPIAILTLLMPVFGGIFYLLQRYLNAIKNG